VATDAGGGALDGSCLILTGAPAAGKSTVSRLVARQLARSALLNGDFVNELIVNGRVWALGEPADEAARQVRLCNQNLCALAANFAGSGFTAVIDSLIPDREQLDYFLHALEPRQVLLVVLTPSISVCRHRNTVRHHEEQFFFDEYETLTTGMRNAFGAVGWWFDTSALTPAETATQIIANGPTLAPVRRSGG
jgi:chloramphenicol 3-O-phosphotransferase